MATLPALMPFQAPQNQVNIGDTYVQMAKIKAYQQQARLDELKIGAAEREASQDALWKSVMAGVYTPEGESGLSAPQPPQAPAAPAGGLATAQAAPAPAAPAQMATAPSLAAAAPSVGNPLPELAQPPPQPASLATAQAPAPTPAAQPPGGLGQGGKTRPMFQGLMQPMNEKALIEAHKINPERTEKWFSGMMKMQGDKLKQTKDMNDQVYQVLKAVERSPNPAEAWAQGMESLRERGIPVPRSMDTYNPAMLQFKLNEHRSADVELTEAKAAHEQQQARTSQALGIKYGAETRGEEGKERRADKAFPTYLEGQRADIAEKQAGTEYKLAQAAREKQAKGLDLSEEERKALTTQDWLATEKQKREFAVTTEAHNAKMRPLLESQQTLENRIKTVQADMALPTAQKEAQLKELDRQKKELELRQAQVGVPQYLKDDADTNTALNEVKKKAGTEGQPPSGKELEQARNAVIQGKIQVAAANQRDAGKAKALESVMTNAVTKAQSAEDVHNVLDDMRDLISRGTLTSTPGDAWRVYAQRLGLRPTDEASARTLVLQSLGEQLTLAKAGGKLGGQVSDADRDLIARATGNFGKLMSPAQQKEALRQLQRSADRDLEHGNRILKQHAETGTVPEFGQVRKERKARTLDQATYNKKWEERKAQGWTDEQAFRRYLSDNQYILDLD